MKEPLRRDFRCTQGTDWYLRWSGMTIDNGALDDADCVLSLQLRRYPEVASSALGTIDSLGEVDLGGIEAEAADSALAHVASAGTAELPLGTIHYRLFAIFTASPAEQVKIAAAGKIIVEPWAPADPVPSPISIFGAARVPFWLAPERWLSASWADETGNLTLVQADSGKQFASTNSIHDAETPTADGVNDYMVGDLVTPIGAGTRPHFFIVRRALSDPGTGTRSILLLSTVGGGSGLALLDVGTVSAERRFRLTQVENGSSVVTWRGPVFDSEPHVTEAAWADSSEDHYLFDGVAQNTIVSGTPSTSALSSACGRVELANNSVSSVAANVAYLDVFAVLGPITAEERASLYEWIAYRSGLVLP